MISLVLLLCAYTWYTQKDIIEQVIKNHMISRQQTQLQEFFCVQEDPVFFIDPETKEILFSNEPTIALFKNVGSSNIDAQLPFLSFN